MRSEDSPWDVTAFRSGVESTLQDFVDERAKELSGLGDDADRMLDQARASIAGGKRFRASFCWWGYQAIGAHSSSSGDEGALLRACSALELLHASALVHDDYMDASDTRRGRPATHRHFEQVHRELGWAGNPVQYGAAAAILLGDLLLSWSDELLRTCGLPAERVLDALRYFDLARTEVVTGQFLDVSAQARGRADVDTAMRVVRYKSAKYSIERPLHIGAALAGAAAVVQQQLGSYGLPLGEAFQLRDDLLGVYGDPQATGKPAGDDLTEGKRTVLVALALDALPPAEAKVLDSRLGTAMSAAEIEELRDLIDRSGAREQVEAVITALTTSALHALEDASIDERARSVLRSLAAATTQRTV